MTSSELLELVGDLMNNQDEILAFREHLEQVVQSFDDEEKRREVSSADLHRSYSL
ncbi:hypothetical protein ACN9MJ_13190 [Acidovorax facilis]|uniref:hypothetical protein n=1 Tax=Acidovorax facilis TaxID=12917 RepID=UPI003CF52C65